MLDLSFLDERKDGMKNIMAEAEAVDVNCMIGRGIEVAYAFETARDLAKQLKKHHVAKAVVANLMALNWNLKDGNEQLLTETGKIKNLIPCPILSPHLGTSEMPSAKDLTTMLRRHRISAVKAYPAKANYLLDTFYAGKLLAILEEFRIPLLLEWDQVDKSSLPAVTAAFPHLPFILLFAGFRASRTMYPLLEKRENVFFDTSRFADYKILEEIVSLFGADRLLFGSGMPCYHPGPAITLVCLADISEMNQRLILSGNWNRLAGGVQWN